MDLISSRSEFPCPNHVQYEVLHVLLGIILSDGITTLFWHDVWPRWDVEEELDSLQALLLPWGAVWGWVFQSFYGYILSSVRMQPLRMIQQVSPPLHCVCVQQFPKRKCALLESVSLSLLSGFLLSCFLCCWRFLIGLDHLAFFILLHPFLAVKLN